MNNFYLGSTPRLVPEYELIQRHSEAIRRIGFTRLLNLPEKVKARLQRLGETNLEGKVIFLEGIAGRYSSKTPLMKVRVDWEVDNEEDMHHLPEVVPIYEKILLDEVADYISDRYGYLVKGFSIESI